MASWWADVAWWVWASWGAGAAAPLIAAWMLWRRSLVRRRRANGPENHRRADNGLAAELDPREKWFHRLALNPWSWVVLAFLVFCGFALWVQYNVQYTGLVQSIISALKQANLPPQTLTQDAFNEGVVHVTGYAALTLAAYVVIFLLFDRWRPSSPSMKLVALLWGACAATFFAVFVNSWVGDLLAAGASGPDIAGNAAAVFVAPFVEEACKASVLFILVMAMRRRVVGVLQMIGLSGLSAAGFAFVENIIYYVQVYCPASLVPGPEADAYLHQMVIQRGVETSFGHPLFTMMTAFGLICGLRQKSKIARVICPLTGYLFAALLHMCFNGVATLGAIQMIIMFGLMIIVGVLGWLVGQFLAQKRIIAWRLDDYVRMGWLRDRDAVVYSAMIKRLKLSVAGWLRGWRIGKATVRLMSDVTELAYLRQGVLTGTLDQGVVGREHELVVDALALRGIALDEPEGLRLVPRYRGPAAWHNFKAWLNRRPSARPQQWNAPVGAPAGMPVGAGQSSWMA